MTYVGRLTLRHLRIRYQRVPRRFTQDLVRLHSQGISPIEQCLFPFGYPCDAPQKMLHYFAIRESGFSG